MSPLQMPPLPWALGLTLLAVALAAAGFDIRYRRIPNWLALTGVILGFLLRAWIDGVPGLAAAGWGFGLALLVYLPLYLVRGMGAGDVKLMAAAGALAGAGYWFWIFVFAAVGGALAGLLLAAAKGRLASTLWNTGFIVRELTSFRMPYLTREQLDMRHQRALRLPHGVAIAAGVLAMAGLTTLR